MADGQKNKNKIGSSVSAQSPYSHSTLLAVGLLGFATVGVVTSVLISIVIEIDNVCLGVTDAW